MVSMLLRPYLERNPDMAITEDNIKPHLVVVIVGVRCLVAGAEPA
jgi:hypothetical protein